VRRKREKEERTKFQQPSNKENMEGKSDLVIEIQTRNLNRKINHGRPWLMAGFCSRDSSREAPVDRACETMKSRSKFQKTQNQQPIES
jgi:hypothetical protein